MTDNGKQATEGFTYLSSVLRLCRLKATSRGSRVADRQRSPDAFEAKLVFSIAKMKSAEEANGEAGRVERCRPPPSVVCGPTRAKRASWR